MKRISKGFIITGVSLFAIISLALAQQHPGEKSILLNGGKSGNITLPHHMHQTIAKECQTCHSLFEQTPGALDAAKESGTLKAKQVMNKVCLKCHRNLKKAGKTHGPVKCSGCHVK